MADHPHTIDRWDDATGENLIEQIAGVGDYLVALATYRAAVKRWPRRTRSRCATERGSSSAVGGTNRAPGRRLSATAAPSAMMPSMIRIANSMKAISFASCWCRRSAAP